MSKKITTRLALVLLLGTTFLAGCANQGHNNNNRGHGNSGGHGNSSSGGHGNSSSRQSGGHGTTVIEDEAH